MKNERISEEAFREMVRSRSGMAGSVFAKWIAERAHSGQWRKFGKKEPYVQHPLRVCQSLSSEHDMIVALLHDTIEDTFVTFEDLKEWFNEEVAQDVLSLSRQEWETYYDFILRLVDKGSMTAIRVKMADLEDNMSDLKEGSMKDKYRLAHYILGVQLQIKARKGL